MMADVELVMNVSLMNVKESCIKQVTYGKIFAVIGSFHKSQH